MNIPGKTYWTVNRVASSRRWVVKLKPALIYRKKPWDYLSDFTNVERSLSVLTRDWLKWYTVVTNLVY